MTVTNYISVAIPIHELVGDGLKLDHGASKLSLRYWIEFIRYSFQPLNPVEKDASLQVKSTTWNYHWKLIFALL